MSKTETIKNILYSTIHRNKKTVAEIADETGISASYLYRAGLPLDESGVKFPIDYAIPLMKATKDYSLLKHITHLCGFILVKVPSFTNSKMDDIDIVDSYQYATLDAVKRLKDFLNDPSAINYAAVDNALQNVMSRSVSAQKYCGKKLSGQIEMDLGE